ncbi:MAG: tRNA (adenosine(37)-N6)-threonylcarbamoyltransferase complex ATPase subunit type 1 TsaE [Gemmatimonadota bacterium]
MRLTEPEVVRWGRAIGQEVQPPVFIALQGPLGAGKSVLARAIGEGAGVDVPMPSPTFNLLLRYDLPSGVSVVHLDLYRISDPEEVWELGWADLGTQPEIVLIEWPEQAGALMPEDYWHVQLAATQGNRKLRDIEVQRVGAPPRLPGFPMTLGRGPS